MRSTSQFLPRFPSHLLVMVLLLTAGLAATAPALADHGAGDGSAPPVREATSAGRAIVAYREGTLPDVRPGDEHRGHEVLWVDAKGGFIVVSATWLDQVRDAVAGDAGVRYVEDDPLMHATLVPDDAQYRDQYGPEQMGAHEAWDITLGSTSVIVAVLDTGIRRSHEDFRPGALLPGWDYSNNDSDPADDCDHGTHVSGTIAATTQNGIGVAGVSQSTILPYKVLSPSAVSCSGATSIIASAVRDAVSEGAHIISMSLGSSGSSSVLRSAVDHAWNNGVLVVAAAGNDGCSGCSHFPSGYESVISVGALTPSKTKASYSNAGPTLEIAAGGSGVISTCDNHDAYYCTMSGTSMATPHVSGGLALALSRSPGIAAADLRQAMAATAEDLGATGWDSSFGHGLMRVDALLDVVVPGLVRPDNLPPSAQFRYGLTQDGSVTFLSTATDDDGDTLAHTWSFGDGTTATGASVDHTLPDGDHEVTLTVTDGAGGSSTASAIVNVSVPIYPADPAPTAVELAPNEWHEFDVEAGDVLLMKVLVHNDDAGSFLFQSQGPSCQVQGLLCELDTTMDVERGAIPGATPDCHSDRKGNAHNCLLTNDGHDWYVIRMEAVEGQGTLRVHAGFDDGNGRLVDAGDPAPQVKFHHVATAAGAPDNVEFDARASTDDGPIMVTWTIDGITLTGPQVKHTLEVGTYAAHVEVEDASGHTSAATFQVVVPGPPAPNAAPVLGTLSHDAPDVSLFASLSGTSDPEGDGFTIKWDLGDGTTSNGDSITHIYAAEGTYTVTVTATDAHGAASSDSFTVVAALPADPDPAVPTLGNGETASHTLAEGDTVHYKAFIPAARNAVHVSAQGPRCTLILCPADFDMYLKSEQRATPGSFDCAAEQNGASGACVAENAGQWWFVSVVAKEGDGDGSIVFHW